MNQGFSRIVECLAANYDGYWRRYCWWIVATGVAAVLDLASTIYFMHINGVEVESHLAIRWVSLWLGPILGPIMGKSCQLVALFLVTLYLRSIAPYLFLVVVILYMWAAWYNIWGYELYTPRLLKWLPL